MTTIISMVPPAQESPVIGPIVLVLILLLLIAGLVLVVRILLVRVHNSTARSVGTEGSERAVIDSEASESKEERPLTGRELKRRYLAGKISRAEYDRRLRSLQIDEFLGGKQ